MIKLDQGYARQDFIDFLQDTFLQDYVRDVRPVGAQGLNTIKKAISLGRSDSLDLQIFEFEYAGSASKRIALTKEAFQIMKQSAVFNALAIFYGQDGDDWRFSFLTANPEKTEKGKTTLAYSNPRRYSFFLGPNAKINTPNRFLIKNGQIKNFDDLLARFNVEIVTKEFFENYKKLFDRLLAYLNKDHVFQSFAGRNGVETANFAKKLLGQIVFLYFLQRKGWLGAKKGDSISMGDKDFLRSLFSKSAEKKVNFYNTYLEPLFYGALNRPPEKAGSYYRSYFDCQIPFLNGGLFEPPQDYNWEGEFLLLPDKLFSKNPNNPSHGDGILDIFDLYNFTVDESDFLDKEVSVDPEMLGKVFENLLEENLRKGKGTYYTPREIVNYMCEESVVNYLTTETGLTSENIKNKYFPSYNVLEDEKFEVRDVSVSEQIIQSLTNIKIVDPACGSGAFLVGMLHQITHLRYDLEERSKLLGRRDSASSEYEIKKQTIQNCIYGVDIDPGAVDIAKLRLWLSLVVDYDLEDIEPLPNLDYKIMQGNSLLEELVLGDTNIKLYDSESIQKARGSKKMKNLFDQETQITLFDGENDKTLKVMKSLQLKYFSTSDSESKKKLKTQIENIEHELIKTSIKSTMDDLYSQKINIRTIPGIGLRPEDVKKLEKISSRENQVFAVLDELEKTGTKPFFLWHLHFSDVFEEKGGFDVVIANPPYISHVNYAKQDKEAISKSYSTFSGRADLYVAFYEQGVRLARENGIVTYISPNKFFRSGYGDKLRKFLYRETQIINIIDFGDAQIFDATTYPAIVTLKKFITKSYKFAVLKTDTASDLRIRDKYSRFDKDYLNGSIWSFNNLDLENIWQKVRKDTVSLKEYIANQFYRGIVTGLNDAFIIDEDQRNRIILENPEADVIIKPYLRGKDVKRWKSDTKFYIIFTYHGIDIANYPAVKDYLLSFKDRLEKRATSKNHEWYELQQPQTGIYRKYEKNKIISTDIAKRCEFTFDKTGSYIDATIFCIPIDDLYLLGLLNSRLLESYFRSISSTIRGNFLRFKKIYLDLLPIKNVSEEQKDKIISLVGKLLDISSHNKFDRLLPEQIQIQGIEKQIDQIVYSLYNLTPEEIAVVEGKNEN